jgi:hypothetical protein
MPEFESRPPGRPPADDPEAGRRRAVALAHARFAHHGGPFADRRVRAAIDLAREYAGATVTLAELRAALRQLEAAADEARGRMAARPFTIFEARRAAAAADEYLAARTVADALVRAVGSPGCATPAATALDARWLTTDVVELARLASAGYTDLLPILADALEDAGCADVELLGHCRGLGPHTPDCWAVELLLCKAVPAPTHPGETR